MLIFFFSLPLELKIVPTNALRFLQQIINPLGLVILQLPQLKISQAQRSKYQEDLTRCSFTITIPMLGKGVLPILA